MRRTFNYTGRSRVTQSMVEIKLRWSSVSLSPTFIAEINFDEPFRYFKSPDDLNSLQHLFLKNKDLSLSNSLRGDNTNIEYNIFF